MNRVDYRPVVVLVSVRHAGQSDAEELLDVGLLLAGVRADPVFQNLAFARDDDGLRRAAQFIFLQRLFRRVEIDGAVELSLRGVVVDVLVRQRESDEAVSALLLCEKGLEVCEVARAPGALRREDVEDDGLISCPVGDYAGLPVKTAS